MELGLRLRKLRESEKWTQEDLANKIYLSEAAYGKVERGETNPNLTQLTNLAKAFKMEISELLGEEKNRYEINNSTASYASMIGIGTTVSNSTHDITLQIESLLGNFSELLVVLKEISKEIKNQKEG